MEATDSREEEAKKLPPECQVTCEKCKLRATPVRMDVCPAGMESPPPPKLDVQAGHQAQRNRQGEATQDAKRGGQGEVILGGGAGCQVSF